MSALNLLDIPSLVFIGHFLVYSSILAISVCHYRRKSIASAKTSDNGKSGSPNRNDILSDLDGNSTDVDMFYETKIKIELQKSGKSTDAHHSDYSGVDSVTEASHAGTTQSTPRKKSSIFVQHNTIPSMIEEAMNEDDVFDDEVNQVIDDEEEAELERAHNLAVIGAIEDDFESSSQDNSSSTLNNEEQDEQKRCCCFSLHFQFLLYILDQSSYFGAAFVYITYSKCAYITASGFDFYYILFVLSVLSIIGYKCMSSMIVLWITRSCKCFALQCLDLLMVQQCFWNIYEIKSKHEKDKGINLWIQRYLQTLQSIFASLPQLVIAIVFVLKQQRTAHRTQVHLVHNAIILFCIASSVWSLVSCTGSNIKVKRQRFGVYFCRFLEISSRMVLLLLIWKCLGTLVLCVLLWLELTYLSMWSLSSHNILIMSNIVYSVIDPYGRKKSHVFITYRIISNYIFGAVIAILTLTDFLRIARIDTNNGLPDFLQVLEATYYDAAMYAISHRVWFCLVVYCFGVQPVAQILLFCRYRENLKSIGQCAHFEQLLAHKCWHEIYELMVLGANYKSIAKHNETNVLCQVCMENESELIHLKIADAYLSKHKHTFFGEEEKFYLPFYYAIQLSTIRMMTLLISHGADIEHLFDNDNWCNSLQCVITSPRPSMNKIHFIIKRLQQRYQQNPLEYDNKIGSFLNYQNGSNYDTALSLLFQTCDYEMMHKGFDRLEAMEYLIWNGANPNILDKTKSNVLHYAIEQKQYRLIKMLLKNGSNIDTLNGYQQSPLSIACRVSCNKQEIIQLLLNGHRSLDEASKHSLKNRVHGNPPDVQLINKPDTHGRVVLHYAAGACSPDIVRYLITRNADCSIRDNDGLTPLHYAVKFNMNLQLETVIELVMSGESEVNSADRNQCSILHDAARHQSLQIIDYLVAVDANIHALDRHGHDAQFYSLGRDDEYKLRAYWKEVYMNNGDVDEEAAQKQTNERRTYQDEEVSELEKMHSLEAFISIINDEVDTLSNVSEVISR